MWSIGLANSSASLAVLGGLIFSFTGLGCGRIAGKPHTVEERLEQHGVAARERLAPDFAAAGVEYPPQTVLLLIMKQERQLLLYAADAADAPWKWVRTYPLLGASGEAGPKLREGDRQVPEGFYQVEMLNPNSRFHLSLRLNYPNAEDRLRSASMGFEDPGSDIMIHGGSASIGCVAVGDPAAEELFVLAADAGLDALQVVIVPWDLRATPPQEQEMPEETRELYERLATLLQTLPQP